MTESPLVALYPSSRIDKFILVAVLILGLLALFGWLGYMPVDNRSDEARRGLVALEMVLSGNYIVPTLNGVPYLNKPPLYNWLIAGSFRLFGRFDSLALRLPMALSLVGYALTIFAVVRRQTGNSQLAVRVALMVALCARIWFYETLLGLIDITFSWLVFSMLSCLFVFDKRQQYGWLYSCLYGLGTLAFLMKGLPAFVFIGLSLLVWFGATGRWSLLIHPAHLGGLLVAALGLGTYYMIYFRQSPVPAATLLGRLVSESAKRTPIERGLVDTALHLLTFPGEFLLHFAPWTLLGTLLWRRSVRQWLFEDRYIRFCWLMFWGNIWVYWLSPEVYARYVLMLLPFLFVVLASAYALPWPQLSRVRWWIEHSWLLAMLLCPMALVVALFHPATRPLPSLPLLAAVGIPTFLAVSWFYWKRPPQRMMLVFFFLVIVRLLFNEIILPGRRASRERYRLNNEAAARLTLGQPLWAETNTFADEVATDVNSFYVSATRRAILPKTATIRPGQLYIMDSTRASQYKHRVVAPILLFKEHRAWVVRIE
ncbi:dolichyl-phosphate-mannose-proteinmannosyltransferase [Fibrella aestuarina BUZ 2]|uniref:Dolichyl-phosphate-mannose-proteinmannosyltransfe rase n=1 Tax=Fibrella aestuarina BUZ 2 TaxID=1166018 RepID=I0K3V4_9BACT|nr:glycosyltransferase family 39 protein [Fibrella aestuarina]CCG98807.1 dolichyl-phosphate-mannose-proteinmannosyltransferase [Fibrella aestuarina BUZ 2]